MKNILIISAAFAVFAGAAHAQEARVSLRGEDLTTIESAERVYEKLETAARRVCRAQFEQSSVALHHQRTCVKQALATAVAQANSPTLAALDDKRQKRVELASR